jgi:hypothetical protein
MAEKPGFAGSMTPLQRLLRRRRFLIHKKLQYQLLLGTFWHMVLVGVIAAAILFLPLIVQLSTSDPSSDIALRAANHLLYLHGRFWPTLVLVAVLIGLDALRTSHRIAGPILRFHRALQEFRAGKVPQTIALRKGDFFLEECAELNEAILESRARLTERTTFREELADSAARLRALMAHDPVSLTPGQRDALDDLLLRAEGSPEHREKAA